MWYNKTKSGKVGLPDEVVIDLVSVCVDDQAC